MCQKRRCLGARSTSKVEDWEWIADWLHGQFNFTDINMLPGLVTNQTPHQLASGDINNDGAVDFVVGTGCHP